MTEEHADSQPETSSEDQIVIIDAVCNPTNDLLVTQFFEHLTEGRVKSALQMLNDKQLRVLSKEDFVKMRDTIKQKDQDIDLWIAENDMLTRANDLLKEELLTFFNGFKQAANLVNSVKPITDFVNEMAQEAVANGVTVKNKASFTFFMMKKVPKMLSFITDSGIQENITKKAGQIDFISPLKIMVKYGAVKPEFLEAFETRQGLPMPGNDLLNSPKNS